jgi:hypothetical protein
MYAPTVYVAVNCQDATRGPSLAAMFINSVLLFKHCHGLTCLQRSKPSSTYMVLCMLCRDSHTKVLFTALQCFMVDFWQHQECRAHTDQNLVAQLNTLPKQPGESRCIHMPGMTRICLVKAVLGTQYVNNGQVSNFARLDCTYVWPYRALVQSSYLVLHLTS